MISPASGFKISFCKKKITPRSRRWLWLYIFSCLTESTARVGGGRGISGVTMQGETQLAHAPELIKLLTMIMTVFRILYYVMPQPDYIRLHVELD